MFVYGIKNMDLQEAKEKIVEEFSMFDEWLDKYEYLIGLGKELEEYPEEARTEDRLIKGCQSRVWLDSEKRDGRLYFKADSDAIITKGGRRMRLPGTIFPSWTR